MAKSDRKTSFRFGLGVFLLAFTVLSVAFGFIGRHIQLMIANGRSQRSAVATLSESGALLTYDMAVYDDGFLANGQLWFPNWGRDLFGDEMFANVQAVRLGPVRNLPIDAWESLGQLRYLERVQIHNVSRIGSNQLAHLENARNLQILDLTRCNVDDEALASLPKLPRLREVNLYGTQVEGAGLKSLHGSIKNLNLSMTPISDDGLANIARFEFLTELYLLGTNVTDDGLKHLECLTRLHELFLHDTKVSGEGITSLTKKLPRCIITWKHEKD